MRSLPDFIERESGQIAISVVLILIGIALAASGLSSRGDELVIFAMGTLSRSMGSTSRRTGGSSGKPN